MKSFKDFIIEKQETIIAYHYTHAEEFTEFASLSHFGTLNAATFMSVNDSKYKKGIPRILEVELKFDRLYRLTYAEEEDDAKLYRSTFVDGKHPELAQVWTRDVPSSIRAFQKMGVDGIVYSNTYDDNGADSYIIFYPHQARIIKTVVRGPRPIRNFQRKMGWE